MNPVFKKRENNRVKFSFEVDEKKFRKEVNNVYKKNKHYFNVPGFRKGKAPRQIIELTYGEGIFYEDALNEILPTEYFEAVKELDLEPVAQPDMTVGDIEKGKNIKVDVEVDVKPEVKLGEYKGLEIKEVSSEVTEDMVETELKKVQEQNARLVDAEDKKIEKGDIANINFKGFLDGEPFEGGEGDNYDLTIGSGAFIPGFEEQLIGKAKGEDVQVEVTFPEDYQAEEFAGKEAVFEVKINSVRIKELPELDDDFAIDVSEFDTLDEYKEDIKNKLSEELEKNAETSLKNQLVEKVIENSEMDIPESMIEEEITQEMGQLDYQLKAQGLGLEGYLNMIGQDMDDMREQLRPSVETKIKGNLVLEAIAEKEEIDVSDEEVDEELKNMAKDYKAEDIDAFVKEMKAQGDLSHVKLGLINEKVLQLLIENKKEN